MFAKQYRLLDSEVVKLQDKLSESDFNSHGVVKLLRAITIGIEDKISTNPFASHFALQHPLKKYCRLKKMGLNERYRLFFRAFKKQKTIIILWLGFPRKEGDKNDCYAVFTNMVAKGVFSESLESLIVESSTDFT